MRRSMIDVLSEELAREEPRPFFQFPWSRQAPRIVLHQHNYYIQAGAKVVLVQSTIVDEDSEEPAFDCRPGDDPVPEKWCKR